MELECKQELALPSEYFKDTIRPQLCSLFEEDALKDVKMFLRDGSVHMSSCILSLLSPVLRTMVCGNFRENICKEISLDDVAKELLLKLLRLACGKEGLAAENFVELLELGELADRLRMEAVRAEVEDNLLKRLSLESCLEIFQRIEVSGLELLQKGCCKMLRDNLKSISQTKEFLMLSEEFMEYLLDQDDLGINQEEDVLDALLMWIAKNDDGTRGEGLLRKVRYGVISNEYLARQMSSASMLSGHQSHELLKQLAEEAMAKKWCWRGVEEWDGLQQLCDKWMVVRGMQSRIIGVEVLVCPTYVALDGQGRIVVSDEGLHEIIVFNPNGSIARRLGSMGASPGQFVHPMGVVVDRAGHIIVADFSNHRIQVLNEDGSVVCCFGSQGTEIGQFNGPCGVAIDSEGRIIVADYGNNRIQVFNMDGSYLHHFTSHGSRNGQLVGPMGVAVGGKGRIVVTEWGNHRVQVFNCDGSVALCFGSKGDAPGQFRYPEGVAVDSAGRFIVADSHNDRIQVFNPDGSVAEVIHKSRDGLSCICRPHGVAQNGAGSIVVAEFGIVHHRVQVI